MLLAAWVTPARLHDHSLNFTAWSFVAFMVRTFTFHAAVGLVVIAMVAAVLGRRRLVVVAGAPGVCVVLASFVRVPAVVAVRAGDDSLTLMTHNVLLINRDAGAILAQIDTTDPDVICFQEYTPTMHALLAPVLAERYPYEVHAFPTFAFGQGVFSKRAFVGVPEITRGVVASDGTLFDAGNGPQISVRVPVGERVVTIHNVHTDAPGSLGHYRVQRLQFERLVGVASAVTEPTIFAGDFNATNSSQHVRALAACGLVDALDANALGRRCTWPDLSLLRFAPGVRIDHVMLTRDLACEAARVGGSTGSDHLPVVAKFRLK